MNMYKKLRGVSFLTENIIVNSFPVTQGKTNFHLKHVTSRGEDGHIFTDVSIADTCISTCIPSDLLTYYLHSYLASLLAS